MTKRLQSVNGDTVLRVTETKPVTVTLSEKALIRRREQLQDAMAKFQGELAVVEEQLSMIYEERNRV